jgi:hypothetical protein
MNFAEIKKKLTEFDEQAVIDSPELIKSCHEDDFIDGAKYQFTKDAKIISGLLEIIEMQTECMNNYQHDNTTHKMNACLSETESKLNQLIKWV